ncbi:P-loop containing nucleoside triphosphate hydrolase protein [Daedalea quercina L-15889]|uniref:p-loop containing nucleoside triphosphate hydrolase protein n=1 Tax=Daedalea quercina L-15889 TaxID=1314783 RepID=A0A165KIE2_9APHY|nr:P-loop containing nucleoside triphosphate hydrolase protein [Daedalea quercina L-15889]
MSQKVCKSQKRSKPTPVLRSTLRLGSPASSLPPPAKRQKTRVVSSLSRPPVFDLTSSQPNSSQDNQSTVSKGKGKAKVAETATVAPDSGECIWSSISHRALNISDCSDDRLWVDRYEPATEDGLAVNKRKVKDVRQWLLEAFDGGPSGKLRKYRRILALTGPAGTGKTATLRVLSRELGFEIVEWRNSIDERFTRSDLDDPEDDDVAEWEPYEGLSDKFRNFLARASSCRSVFGAASPAFNSQSHSRSSTQSQSQPPSSALISASQSSSTSLSAAKPAGQTKRQVILLEDLPNILHPGTQAAFHAALEAFVALPDAGASPLVLIASDAGLRGEDTEADGVGGSTSWRRAKEAVDIRSVLPPQLLSSPYVTQIGFRPIAPTYLRPALQSILNKHFAGSKDTLPSKDVLSMVVDSAHGDIRSAIMALQFACTVVSVGNVSTMKKKKGVGGPDARAVIELVTRREQSLALFHLLGKLLYNKRKDDPPNANASVKELQRDREIDSQLQSQPSLPAYLKEHKRRTSRVDVDMLYADSPIDASLLSLYVHQNYTQYCNDLGECDSLADWFSWIDANGAESWHQANPHRFHLLALSTLHSLPSPVQRRNQKPYKPVFFENLQRERDAEDGLRDVQDWLLRDVEFGAGAWSRRDVALELGGVLKARDLLGARPHSAPPTHRRFSRLEFSQGSGGLVQLSEEGDDAPEDVAEEDEEAMHGCGRAAGSEDEPRARGWLSDDDIEDF